MRLPDVATDASRDCRARFTAASRRAPSIGAAMTTIDLVYFNAGGGHRAAALALQEVDRASSGGPGRCAWST